MRSYRVFEPYPPDMDVGCLDDLGAGETGHVSAAIEPDVPMHRSAATIVRRLLGERDDRIDAVVVCQTSLDADYNLNVSQTLSIQKEIGFKGLGFAVMGQDGLSPFIAYQLIDSLMRTEPDVTSAVLCGVERWRYPLQRIVPGVTVLGDGAASQLLVHENTCTAAGWRLVDLHVDTTIGDGPAPDGSQPDLSVEAMARWAICVIRELSTRIGYDIRSIDRIIPSHLNGPVVRAVHAGLGLSQAQISVGGFGTEGYLGAADPLVRFQDAQVADIRNVLVWSSGLKGGAAAAVFEAFSGSAA